MTAYLVNLYVLEDDVVEQYKLVIPFEVSSDYEFDETLSYPQYDFNVEDLSVKVTLIRDSNHCWIEVSPFHSLKDAENSIKYVQAAAIWLRITYRFGLGQKKGFLSELFDSESKSSDFKLEKWDDNEPEYYAYSIHIVPTSSKDYGTIEISGSLRYKIHDTFKNLEQSFLTVSNHDIHWSDRQRIAFAIYDSLSLIRDRTAAFVMKVTILESLAESQPRLSETRELIEDMVDSVKTKINLKQEKLKSTLPTEIERVKDLKVEIEDFNKVVSGLNNLLNQSIGDSIAVLVSHAYKQTKDNFDTHRLDEIHKITKKIYGVRSEIVHNGTSKDMDSISYQLSEILYTVLKHEFSQALGLSLG